MYNTDSRGISWTAGFFMLIAFTIAGLMVATALTGPIWTAMTGKSIAAFQNGPWQATDTPAFQLIQAVNALVGFFFPTLITAAALSRRPMQVLGFTQDSSWKDCGLVILVVVTSLFFSTALSYFNNQLPMPDAWKASFDRMEEVYNRQVEFVVGLRAGDTRSYLLALLIMAVIPGLCEETLFRGGLQNFLARGTKKPWLSILIVSVLFSLAHFSYYGFLYRVFLGVVLGAIYHYSGRLRLSILAHFLHNAIGVTAIYVYVQQGKPLHEALKMESTNCWGLLALPLLIGSFILFKKSIGPRQTA